MTLTLVENFDFSFIRIIVAFAMLGIATFLDIKNREIHDFYWIVFGGIAVLLLIMQYDDSEFVDSLIISIVFLVPISLGLWYFGVFGGADAFALIVLSVLAPSANITESIVSPITVLVNASIFAIVPMFVNAAINLKKIMSNENIFEGFDEPKFKKILACFIGTRQKVPKHSFSIEINKDGTKKFDFSFHHAEHADYCQTKNSWVTPGLPFLLYITLGFIAQVFFGDILFSILLG